MRAAKTFAYVGLGILALMGAFHLGAQTAQGQASGEVIAATSTPAETSGEFFIITRTGDVWRAFPIGPFKSRFLGNVFAGEIPVPTKLETSWGRIKADRR